MANAVSFVGKERKEKVEFITEAGKYLMKIVKHEVDGYTQEGNEKNKYTFECHRITVTDGKPSLSKDKYTTSETYSADEKTEWVFMNLADALKIDVAFDPEALVGYSVIADVDMNKSVSNGKFYPNVNPYSYKYSIANDKLPKVPSQSTAQAVEVAVEMPVIDIDEDEIPF